MRMEIGMICMTKGKKQKGPESHFLDPSAFLLWITRIIRIIHIMRLLAYFPMNPKRMANTNQYTYYRQYLMKVSFSIQCSVEPPF